MRVAHLPSPTPTPAPWSTGQLGHRAPPVRIIEEVRDLGPTGSALVVSGPDGSTHVLPVGHRPRPAAADDEVPAHHRPLAARFEVSGGDFECTCLTATPVGPRRLPMSVPAALALVQGGLHGIVTTTAPGPGPRTVVETS